MRRRSARSPWRVAGSIILGLLATVLLVLLTAVVSLRWLNPPTTAFMLEARAHAWWAGERHYRTEYRWKSLEEISPQAALAVIASEDQEFPFHYGFDFTSIRAAVRAHEHGARLRGASTISQQVAKNLFLSADRSLARKGIEALLTVMIETCWPKERILEVYLNVVQFGYGVYGVEAAARHFFHVPATQLTAPESALLAAVLPNPRRLHVNAPSRYVLAQRDHILQQMANLGGAAYLRAIEPTAASARGDAMRLSTPRE
jgi:monofunctional glycosyltransferase